MLASQVYEKCLYIINDPRGYILPQGEFLTLLNQNLQKIFRKFEINKRIFFLTLFPNQSRYFSVSRGEYTGQIIDSALSITSLWNIKSNSYIKVEYSRGELKEDTYTNDNTIYFFAGSSVSLSVYPIPLMDRRIKVGNNFAIFNPSNFTTTLPSGYSVKLPFAVNVFARYTLSGQQYVQLAYQGIYNKHNATSNTLEEFSLKISNPLPNGAVGVSYEVYEVDVAYECVVEQVVASLNDDILVEDDFLDLIVNQIVSQVFMRMRMYQDATLFMQLAEKEEKRLLNSHLFTKHNPYEVANKIYNV